MSSHRKGDEDIGIITDYGFEGKDRILDLENSREERHLTTPQSALIHTKTLQKMNTIPSFLTPFIRNS